MRYRLHLTVALFLIAFILIASACAPSETPPPTITTPDSRVPTPLSPAPTAGSPTGPGTLIVFHTNDVHAHITPSRDKDVGGYARVATLVNQARAKNERVLLLDAGDVLQGTPFWTEFDGQATVEAMNAMGYDALTLGNHEFDRGPVLLAQRVGEMRFPVLCANLEFAADSPLRAAAIRPYTVLDLDGLRVGILGLTTERTTSISAGAFQGVTAHSAVETARKLVPELRARADLVIALTHLGVDEDYDLVAKVDGIDLIVGGHSHADLRHPAEARSPGGQRVLIAQAGAYGPYLGRIDLTVDPAASPPITSAQGQLVELTGSVADDTQVKAIVDRWQAQLPPSTAVGQTSVDLDLRARGREAAVGNLYCDAILDYFAGASDPVLRADVAMYNSGGIRGGRIFPAGPITTEDIAEWEPFGNTVVVVDLTALQLKEVLESGAKGWIMQVAGLTYQVDNSKPSQVADDDAKKIVTPGQRVVRITIGGQDVDLTDATQIYRVAVNNYLASGGDGCYTFLEGANAVDSEILMTDVLETYIRKHSPIAPRVENRITFGSR